MVCNILRGDFFENIILEEIDVNYVKMFLYYFYIIK